MALAVGDVVEAGIWCQESEQTALMVRHYVVGSIAPGGIPEQILANSFGIRVGPLIKAVLGSQASYWGVSVQRVRPNPTIRYISRFGNGPGAVMGDSLPRQTCGLVTLRTNLPGRRKNGRVYVPFPSVASNDVEGRPTPPYRVGLSNLAFELCSDLIATDGVDNYGTVFPVVYSRKTETWRPISGYIVRTNWATQRRRGSYGRRNSPPDV